MYPFIAAPLALVAIITLIIGLAKKVRIYYEGEWLYMVAIMCGALSLIVVAAWGFVYTERWDREREVEAFVKSEIYVKYAEIVTASSENEIVKLQAVGINVQDLINKINWANTIIYEYSAGNNTFWFDCSYPDWNPPDIIKLK